MQKCIAEANYEGHTSVAHLGWASCRQIEVKQDLKSAFIFCKASHFELASRMITITCSLAVNDLPCSSRLIESDHMVSNVHCVLSSFELAC